MPDPAARMRSPTFPPAAMTPLNCSREMMPSSEFLNIFGLSLNDVKNYLEE